MHIRPKVAALLLAAITAALYVPALDHVPPYLHDAEVLFALHAHSIATTARDTNGRLLPVYLQMPEIGENVWFQPVIAYASVPFLLALPFTQTTVRLPSVFVGVLDVVLLFFVARRLFHSDRWATASAMILLLTPAHFIHSRILMDYLYPVPFVLGWLLCLLIYVEHGRDRMLFAGTTLLGLGFYSYIASVAMMPIYLGLTWSVLYTTGRRDRRPYAIAAAGFAWPLVFIAAWILLHPSTVAQTMGRYRIEGGVSVPGVGRVPLATTLEQLRSPLRFADVTGRVSLYWYFFDPAYLFLTGGYANVVNSTRHVGVFLIPLIVLVPAGLIAIATERRPLEWIVVAGFVTAPVAACLAVPEPYAIDRELELLPFAALAAAAGLRAILARTPRWRHAVLIGVLAIGGADVVVFGIDYFKDYRGRSSFWFEGNHRGAFDAIIARAPAGDGPPIYLSRDSDPYVASYWRFSTIERHREDLRARTVLFRWETLDAAALPSGTLVLGTRQDPRASSLVASGTLHLVASIPEPADPPYFLILQR